MTARDKPVMAFIGVTRRQTLVDASQTTQLKKIR